MAKDRREDGFLAGLVVGGVIGAGLALILGGEDKEELARKLKTKGKAVLKNLEGLVEEGRQKAEKTKEQAGKKVEELKSSSLPSRRFFTRSGKKLS